MEVLTCIPFEYISLIQTFLAVAHVNVKDQIYIPGLGCYPQHDNVIHHSTRELDWLLTPWDRAHRSHSHSLAKCMNVRLIGYSISTASQSQHIPNIQASASWGIKSHHRSQRSMGNLEVNPAKDPQCIPKELHHLGV